jgi:hypothetical protein
MYNPVIVDFLSGVLVRSGNQEGRANGDYRH